MSLRTRSWYPALVLPLYALVYGLTYKLGVLLYLEPAPVSALWPAGGLAIGVLVLSPTRWWRYLLPVQFLVHGALGVIDADLLFGTGVAVANTIESWLAAALIRRWCRGTPLLSEPAHLARLAAAAGAAVVPAALIGALTIQLTYGWGNFLDSARIWLLGDLVGILVVTPAMLALHALRGGLRGAARSGELVAMGCLLAAMIVVVGFLQPGRIDPLLQPALIWVPLLWIGARAGPVATALAAAIAAVGLVVGADLDLGAFVEPGRSATQLSLTVQVFVAVLSLGTLLIAASASGRQLAIEEVGATAERLRITLDGIGDGVIATDRDAKVVLLNPVARELTGWHSDGAIGRSVDEVFVIESALTGEPATNPVTRVLRDGVVVGLANHTELIHRDGSRRQIADSGAPIRDATGAVVGAVLVFRDVTERYRLEERLRQTEKLEAIGRLSSGIAHDLNNMLNGVMGGADLLRMRAGDDQHLAQPVGMIINAVKRMRELNARLLAFARRDPAAQVPVAVAVDPLVADAAELMRHAVGSAIAVDTALTAEGVVVQVDRAQFQSALLNLAVNGRDAMRDGGTLLVSTARAGHGERELVAVAVADQGEGMPPEIQARAFEPFFTTKAIGQGTGLGLHAVRSFVESHGGRIEVESEAGRGTTITMLLPVQAATASAAEAESSGSNAVVPQAAGGERRILLVDDDDIILETTGEQLRALGYTVVSAVDGVEGLEALAVEALDAVVLDVVMPRMDGIEMLRELRRSHPGLPVLLVSGRLPDVELGDLLAQGPTTFLEKPYRVADLQRELQGLGCGVG